MKGLSFYLLALSPSISNAFVIVPPLTSSSSSSSHLSMAASPPPEAVYGDLLAKLERAGSLMKEAVSSRVQQIDIPDITKINKLDTQAYIQPGQTLWLAP